MTAEKRAVNRRRRLDELDALLAVLQAERAAVVAELDAPENDQD